MGPLPQAKRRNRIGLRYIFQSENVQSVCFTGNMLRERGKVQDLPTA